MFQQACLNGRTPEEGEFLIVFRIVRISSVQKTCSFNSEEQVFSFPGLVQ